MTGDSAGIGSSDDDPPPLTAKGTVTEDESPEEACFITPCDSAAEILPSSYIQESENDNIGEKYEEILSAVGGFGKYQKFVVYLIVLPAIFANGLLGSSWLLLVNEPEDYWCAVPELSNASFVDLLNATSTNIVWNITYFRPKPISGASADVCGQGDPVTTSKCCSYDMDYREVGGYSGFRHISDYWNSSAGGKNITVQLSTCKNGWVFDQSFLFSSIVTDFGLVCDAGFLPTLGYILPSIGGVLGIVAGGIISDKYGRKQSFFVFLILLLIFGPAVALSSNFTVYVVLSTLASLPSSPLYSIPYTLGLEIISPEMRMTCSVLITVAFTMGGVALVGVAYVFREWKAILLISTVPSILFLAYWSIMPESPRWLLSQGRFKELHRYFERIAKYNGKKFSLDTEDKLSKLQALQQQAQQATVVKTSVLDLFRTKALLKKTIFLSYLSFCLSTVYVGLYFYAPSLGPNPFLNLLLSSLIELPSSLLTETIAGRLGRRLTLLICLLLGVACMLGTAGLPSPVTHYTELLILFCSARLFMTSAYTVQELMVYESFPTIVRGEAVSFITLFSYVVSSFGPLIVHFRHGDFTLPFIVFGVMSLIAAGCVLVLPETAGPLSESMEEPINSKRRRTWVDMMVKSLLRASSDKKLSATKAIGIII